MSQTQEYTRFRVKLPLVFFFLRSWVFPRVLNTPHKKLRSIPQGFFPVEEVDIISWETFGSWSLTWSIPGECSMVKCQANQAFFSVESLWFSIMSMFHTQRSVVQFFVFSLGVFIPFVSRRICCELDVLTNALPLKPNIDTQISPYICKGRYQGVTVADCQVHGSHAKIGISPSTVPWRNIVWCNIDLPVIPEILHHLPKNTVDHVKSYQTSTAVGVDFPDKNPAISNKSLGTIISGDLFFETQGLKHFHKLSTFLDVFFVKKDGPIFRI